ncbi:3-hydroxyacyl-CoA dehydrogenase NAD-binding domain-containing protein [Streptomyces sp. NPDC007905]|uniref:3-hydroxyacyl-CoA dehydrogenase family protein n=1 Tax=Streptomyces sp. NPDC007905 TaxID=3364788 RepID=UPI0036EDC08A
MTRTTQHGNALGVIGPGTVGRALATAAAQAGLRVTALARDEAGAAAARTAIEAALPPAARPHLVCTADPAALATADLVVEAVQEDLSAKLAALATAHTVCPPHTVFATTSAALSVTELAEGTGRPDRVAGLHVLPPLAPGAAAEVVPTAHTAPTALTAVRLLVRDLGLTPVQVGDRPGRVAGLLYFAFLGRAARMYEEGYASADQIDTALRLGCGLPTGPLARIDELGVDTVCDALTALAAATGDRRLEPAPVLRQLVREGRLGRKSGAGFHRYAGVGTADEPRTPALRPTGIGRVAVVGSGTMAAGIAEVCVRAGFATVITARSEAKAETTRSRVAASLMRATARGHIGTGEGRAALGLLSARGSLAGAAGADLVIEAVAEDTAVKETVFQELGRICRPGVVLATGTSSLPVADCATASRRPEDVVGLHFFHPAPRMRLVEVVATPKSAPATVETAQAFATALGKQPVLCEDRAGFVVNALLFPYLNQALELLGSHYADTDVIDTVMRTGCGFPTGPFELLDSIGLDVSLRILGHLHEAAPGTHQEPSPLLAHLVRAGLTGRKPGTGLRGC